MYNLKHIKLNSGEEIICEVIDWPSENETDVVIRNVMKIVEYIFGDVENYEKVHSFKPWFNGIESSDELIILNNDHIVGITNPNQYMVYEYKHAVEIMHNESIHKKKEYKKQNQKAMEQLAKVLNEISNEKKTPEPEKQITVPDNVIKFPNLEE